MPDASAIADEHPYLATARPEWSRSMFQVRRDGGPWYCKSCDTLSLLVYRCSSCGAELSGDANTMGESTLHE